MSSVSASRDVQAPQSFAARKPAASEPAAPTSENSAARLIASAHDIERVEIIREDTGGKLGELAPTELVAVRRALGAATPCTDMTLTAPRWRVRINFHIRDQATPVIATPVGVSRVRINATHPNSSVFGLDNGRRDPNVVEIEIGEATFDAFARVIGNRIQQRKEYQADPELFHGLR